MLPLLLRRSPASASAWAGAARAFSSSSPRSFARIAILGNLAQAPESFESSKGRPGIRYTVATTSGPKDNRQTSWFRIVSFVEDGRRDYILGLTKG